MDSGASSASRESLERGLADSAAGRVHDLGSFAQYAPGLCPTRVPEPHLLGEFPMTCYRCHIDADS